MVRGRNAFPPGASFPILRTKKNERDKSTVVPSVGNTVDRFVRFHEITRILSTYSNVAGARSAVVNSYREQLLEIRIGEGTREARLAALRAYISPLERAFLLAAAFLRPPAREHAPDEEKDIGYSTLWNGEKRKEGITLLEKWEQNVDLRRYGLSTALINCIRCIRFADLSWRNARVSRGRK